MTKKDETRSALAKASHVHAGAKTQARARQRETELTEALRAAGVAAAHVGDTDEFDVETPTALVEVKTLLLQNNDKVTVHPRSLRRKLYAAAAVGKQAWLVAIDDRRGRAARRVYARQGVGSWRLRNMESVGTLAGVAELLSQ